MAIDYERFGRVVRRSVEVGTDDKLPKIIGVVYKASAEGPIQAFLATDKVVNDAMNAFRKEHSEAIDALAKMDAPYRVARSAVLAMVPTVKLPDTLKAQPTDTDKLKAIEDLLDLIDDHTGTPWADTLLQEEFGKQAPQTVKELNEAIAANKALSVATAARAAAYGLAYEAYLSFKRVVRDALGPGSKEYKRIHLRASPGAGQDVDQDEGKGKIEPEKTEPGKPGEPKPE